MKPSLFKATILSAVILALLLLAACAVEPTAPTEPTTAPTEATTAPTEATTTPTEATTTPTEATTAPTAPSADSVIKKFVGAADETGIYSTVITLSDKAADKGVVEMVYYGPKGSPQENSIVNTFRIEYEKEAAGTFEIRTFFDGETYQNYHHTAEVKVTNTFSATLRARNVIVSYTPDGSETQEIYRADAEEFYKP